MAMKDGKGDDNSGSMFEMRREVPLRTSLTSAPDVANERYFV